MTGTVSASPVGLLNIGRNVMVDITSLVTTNLPKSWRKTSTPNVRGVT